MKGIPGTETGVSYSLVRSNRKTIAITVEPDLSVMVRAPFDAATELIDQTLRKRAGWIVRQQKFFAQFLPKTPPRAFVSGETHLYMGRRYRLRIRLSEKDDVKLRGEYIYVYTLQPANAEKIKELLYQWYAAHAQVRFAERLAACMDSSLGRKVETPKLHIRRMSKRWGSCRPGQMTLNLDLIRAPRACIDYVIFHELCHLRYPNHSLQFYELLTAALPDWQKTKLRLEQALS